MFRVTQQSSSFTLKDDLQHSRVNLKLRSAIIFKKTKKQPSFVLIKNKGRLHNTL